MGITNIALAAAVAALRGQGKDDEADELEAAFAKEAADAEAAKQEARVAAENLRRATAKQERAAATKRPKTIGAPQDEPLWSKIKGLPLDEQLVAIGRWQVSEHGADFGPPPANFRGVPQRGSTGTPRVHVASWVERAFAETGGEVEQAADAVGVRVEKKIDHLMLTARERVVRGWRLMVYAITVAKHRGDELAAQKALASYDWDAVPVYDASALASESAEPEYPHALVTKAVAVVGGDAHAARALLKEKLAEALAFVDRVHANDDEHEKVELAKAGGRLQMAYAYLDGLLRPTAADERDDDDDDDVDDEGDDGAAEASAVEVSP